MVVIEASRCVGLFVEKVISRRGQVALCVAVVVRWGLNSGCSIDDAMQRQHNHDKKRENAHDMGCGKLTQAGARVSACIHGVLPLKQGSAGI